MDAPEIFKGKAAQTILSDPFSEYTRKVQDRLLLSSGACLLWALRWAEINLGEPVSSIPQRPAGIVLLVLSTYFCIVYVLATRADTFRFEYASFPSMLEVNAAVAKLLAANQEWLKALVDSLYPKTQDLGQTDASITPRKVPFGADAIAAEGEKYDRDADPLIRLLSRYTHVQNARRYLEITLPVIFWLVAACFAGVRLFQRC